MSLSSSDTLAETEMAQVELVNVTPKIVGACSSCNRMVFDVTARFGQGEPNEGQPKQLGAPQPDAKRVTFLLASGEIMDLTFCGDCLETLNNDDYPPLWGRVLVSWMAELGENRPDWIFKQSQNAILCEINVQDWTDVMRSAH